MVVWWLVHIMHNYSRHISDSMDALEAVRPSMFADITVNRKTLTVYCTHRMVRSCLMCWKNSQII